MTSALKVASFIISPCRRITDCLSQSIQLMRLSDTEEPRLSIFVKYHTNSFTDGGRATSGKPFHLSNNNNCHHYVSVGLWNCCVVLQIATFSTYIKNLAFIWIKSVEKSIHENRCDFIMETAGLKKQPPMSHASPAVLCWVGVMSIHLSSFTKFRVCSSLLLVFPSRSSVLPAFIPYHLTAKWQYSLWTPLKPCDANTV